MLRFLEKGLERAGDLLANFALGLVPEAVINAHGRSELITPTKLDGGLRPLLIGSMCRRIAMKGVARLVRSELLQHAGQTNWVQVRKTDVHVRTMLLEPYVAKIQAEVCWRAISKVHTNIWIDGTQLSSSPYTCQRCYNHSPCRMT